MVLVIKCALLAPILLMVLASQFASSKETTQEFRLLADDKLLEAVIPCNATREKLKYFLEHYPAPKNNSQTEKVMKTLRRLSPNNKKSHGKNRWFWDDIITLGKKVFTPNDYRNEQRMKHCRDHVCKCKQPEHCERIRCPLLPIDPGQCAQKPTCHPFFCVLQPIEHNPKPAIATPTSTASPTVSSTTTTKSKPISSTSTTAPPQLNPWPAAEGHPVGPPSTDSPGRKEKHHSEHHEHHHSHHEQHHHGHNGHHKNPEEYHHEEDHSVMESSTIDALKEYGFKGCFEHAVKRAESELPPVCNPYGYPPSPESDSKYLYAGLYYLDTSINPEKLNSTSKMDLIKMISSAPDEKFDPKMKSIMKDLLKYFGDRQMIKTNEDSANKGKTYSRMAGQGGSASLGNAGAAVIGNFANAVKSHQERTECGCSNVYCTPNNLEECDGTCLNNPGCPIYQCKCSTVLKKTIPLAPVVVRT